MHCTHSWEGEAFSTGKIVFHSNFVAYLIVVSWSSSIETNVLIIGFALNILKEKQISNYSKFLILKSRYFQAAQWAHSIVYRMPSWTLSFRLSEFLLLFLNLHLSSFLSRMKQAWFESDFHALPSSWFDILRLEFSLHHSFSIFLLFIYELRGCFSKVYSIKIYGFRPSSTNN